MSPLRSPSEMRVRSESLGPILVNNPELLAPLARAIHNGKCPACGAGVFALEDTDPRGSPRVQITCFGDPPHAYFFAAATGHIADLPSAMGEVLD